MHKMNLTNLMFKAYAGILIILTLLQSRTAENNVEWPSSSWTSYGARIVENPRPVMGLSKVCYDHFGCFSNEFPFYSKNRLVTNLPQPPQIVGTTFFLYTRNTNPEEELIPGHLQSLRDSHYRSQHNTKFIVHGFIQHSRVSWISNMVQQLLKYDDINVIVVDWKNGARWPYAQAVANTRLVGIQVAHYIQFLIRQGQAQMWQFHIIGHSLGAHVAGYAGQKLKNLPRISGPQPSTTSQEFSITKGLDPASVFFQVPDQEVRLDHTDAEFVDVIHTDGGPNGFGLMESMGHVDFYPNQGMKQPRCPDNVEDIYQRLSNERAELPLNESYVAILACNHLRAVEYFTESINTKCPFIGFACDNWWNFHLGKCWQCTLKETCSPLGFHATKTSKRQSFFLSTAAKPPYCTFYYQVNLFVSRNQRRPTKGDVSVLLIAGGNETLKQHTEITHMQPVKTSPQTLIALQALSYLFQNEHDIGEETMSAVVKFTSKVSLLEMLRYDRSLHVDRLVIDALDAAEGNKTLTMLCGGMVRSGHAKTFSSTNCPLIVT